MMEDRNDLIESYLEGEMSVREQMEFENLLRNDPELMKAFLFRKNLNEAITENDVMDLRDNLNSITSEESLFKHSKKIRIYSAVAAVAAVLIAVSIIFFSNDPFNKEDLYDQYYSKYPSIVNARSFVDSEEEKIFLQSFESYENGEFEKAIRQMRQLLQKDESNNLLLFYLAISELEQGQLTDSEKHLKQLIANSNHIFLEQAHWYLALNYLKQNKTEDSKIVLNLIINQKFSMHQEAESLLRKIN